MQIDLQAFDETLLQKAQAFTDRWIGQNYYSEEELREVLELSVKDHLNASWAAMQEDEMVGIRLCYAPGAWTKKFKRGLSPDLWPVEESTMAYFKSLFIHRDQQQKGLGQKLSQKAIEQLKQMGAKAVLCHSWLESPGNSSQRYLLKMGFTPVKEHPLFWNPIDYLCTRCAPDRCQCTAIEMVKLL